MKYDILLRNGYLVDFSSNFEGKADIGIKDGFICEIAEELNADLAREAFDLHGAMVMPGIIDTHVHASAWLGGGVPGWAGDYGQRLQRGPRPPTDRDGLPELPAFQSPDRPG